MKLWCRGEWAGIAYSYEASILGNFNGPMINGILSDLNNTIYLTETFTIRQHHNDPIEIVNQNF